MDIPKREKKASFCPGEDWWFPRSEAINILHCDSGIKGAPIFKKPLPIELKLQTAAPIEFFF